MTRLFTASSRYESPDEGHIVAGNDDKIASEMAIAKNITEILQHFYPGHFWMVHVDARQGIAYLKIPTLMPKSHCYNIHLHRVSGPNDLVRVVKHFGGEILERFNIPRSGIDVSSYCAAAATKTLLPGFNPVDDNESDAMAILFTAEEIEREAAR